MHRQHVDVDPTPRTSRISYFRSVKEDVLAEERHLWYLLAVEVEVDWVDADVQLKRAVVEMNVFVKCRWMWKHPVSFYIVMQGPWPMVPSQASPWQLMEWRGLRCIASGCILVCLSFDSFDCVVLCSFVNVNKNTANIAIQLLHTQQDHTFLCCIST